MLSCLYAFYLFSYLIDLTSTSSTMLNWSSENKYHSFILNSRRQKKITLLLLSMWVKIAFSLVTLYQIKDVPF